MSGHPRAVARALDAAGITQPRLRASYDVCRRLHAEHGKTYYLATLLLPPAKRPHVWALYGFARYADEFVDSLEHPDPQALLAWGDAFLATLTGPAGPGSAPQPRPAPTGADDPVGLAMRHTMRVWGIPRAHVEAFLGSMRRDITVTGYRSYADLEEYMFGSASVIGLQMLPILEPRTPEATPRARALGEAFQMSNFIRDVGEDLERGRVYLPQEDLDAFGVTRDDLWRGRLSGRTTARVRDLVRFEVQRTRVLYAKAEPGIAMLHPTSRDCVRTAFRLYGGILDAVEAADYRVLDRRVSVPLPRRLRVAVPHLAGAALTRRAESRWRTGQPRGRPVAAPPAVPRTPTS